MNKYKKAGSNGGLVDKGSLSWTAMSVRVVRERGEGGIATPQ